MTGVADPASELAVLVERLRLAEEALQAITDGQVDAVVDPRSSAPILLSHAQRALARSEARYRDLVNRDPSLVWELTPDGLVQFANQAASDALEEQPDSLLGRDFWQFVTADGDAARLREQSRAMLVEGEITGVELPLRTRSGDLRWIAWNSANRRDIAGNLETIVLFGTDVTARREAEARARELEAERIARAEAEASNRAKTQFLAVMSHELRTPLNAISGYVQLLQMELKGPVTDAQREDLTRINRAQLHLLGLINDVMNFARLETGSLRLQLAPVPLAEVLDVLRSLTEPQTASKGLTYSLQSCPPDVIVCADRDKLQQVLINLVSNAIKFTEPGGRLDVTLECHDDRVEINVADTGPGIPADRIDTIFEPFVQIRTGYTRPADGVGLGLSISRELARAMRGEIMVESEVGRGSVFTLVVPRGEDRAD